MALPMSNLHRLLFLACLFLWACSSPVDSNSAWVIHDPDLELELIAQQPDIRTPIGLVIDREDALYVIESHTHTPPEDYQGPAFDRIKKGLDEDGDGLPDRWEIFADSIEDGMNLCFVEDVLHLITKDQLIALPDQDQNHQADEKRILVEMTQPAEVYDHAALLGIAYGQDGWIYASRGNVGGKQWKITAADGSSIEGYGDGGNVFRCRVDGSGIEEVATGFWNPFDLRFTAEGRLLLTDNDPDSRGPNRLIEIVPGGDYGYQSLYGGSGIHPYLAWNGELPGTLPFAAPLGEAPCALIDAKFTHFGEAYTQTVLVNIWEENNIVRIPLTEEGSTVKGTPEVLVQGDSTFHPVGFATNSKGELFISDWVIRQYPNHGQGKIWRLKRKDGGNMGPLKLATPIHQELPSMTEEEMLAVLQTSEDLFVQSMLRRMLALQAPPEVLKGMVQSTSDLIKMQGILVYSEAKEMMPAPLLRSLLKDSNPNIRQTALRYAGQQTRTEVGPAIERMLGKGLITAEMFETYLATLRHVQPTFAEPFQERKEERSRALPRVLPEGYLTEVVQDASLSEAIRALAVPYMKVKKEDQVWLGKQLTQASDASFQVGLIKVLKQLPQKHPTNSNC